jgi:hypothetical protein
MGTQAFLVFCVFVLLLARKKKECKTKKHDLTHDYDYSWLTNWPYYYYFFLGGHNSFPCFLCAKRNKKQHKSFSSNETSLKLISTVMSNNGDTNVGEDPFAKYTLVRKFDRGKKATGGVYLLSRKGGLGARRGAWRRSREKDFVVKKVYNVQKRVERKRFNLEIKHLTHLHACNFVPKLLANDSTKGEIYMTYCGKRTPDTYRNRARTQSLVERLYRKWGMTRYSWTRPRFHITLQNTATSHKGKLFLLDFGSSHWRIGRKG